MATMKGIYPTLRKPKIMNQLFKRFGNQSPPFYATMAVERIKRKFPLEAEKRRLISLMAELPLNKKERTSVKRKITILIKRHQKMVDDYEKKYGEIILQPEPTEYHHHEAAWLNSK